MRELALRLREGTASLEDALFSRTLPRAVLYEFACMCAKEILLRGALSKASILQIQRIHEKHPWLSEEPHQTFSERDWLKQVYLSAKITFWGEEDEEDHLYEDDDEEDDEEDAYEE